MGQGRWVGAPKGANSMVVPELGCRKALVGTGKAISLLCANGLRKQSASLVGPPFLAMRFFLGLHRLS